LELIRAGAARLRARHGEIAALFGPLPSGYHRDLQLTKEPFVEGMAAAADLVAAVRPVLATLTVDPARCRAAMTPAIGATDEVYRRVAAGEPFRAAYRAIAADPDGAVGGGSEPADPAESWRLRTHLGAPGALGAGRPGAAGAAGEALAPLRAALAAGRAWQEATAARLAAVWDLLEAPDRQRPGRGPAASR
jgi:argininosuccinate lyase